MTSSVQALLMCHAEKHQAFVKRICKQPGLDIYSLLSRLDPPQSSANSCAFRTAA